MPCSCKLARLGVIYSIFIFLNFLNILSNLGYTYVHASSSGSWELLVQNAGVSAMHMTLTPLNTVIIYDRTDYGPSQMKLPNGKCRNDSRDFALKNDCYAHSVELNLSMNYSVRPLEVLTDTWCSSASFLSDGTLVSTGGWNDGSNVVRLFVPCNNRQCDWNELPDQLGQARWYASNQILPDNRVIVVGGRRSFSFEFAPKNIGTTYSLPFLYQTNEPSSENNLYPFLHLSSDGNLFIFANSKSILLDYKANRVVRTYPELEGGSRNYPSSGSSVMLPLSGADNYQRVEVMICGGSPHGAWQQVANQTYPRALSSCGRMVITDPNPTWSIENMPTSRVMGDMLILPTSEILIINGAKQGTAGWGYAVNPSLAPFLYKPSGTFGSRFQVLAASSIPRMYHSSAILIPDGRVLVAGSNTNEGYTFSDVPYPTELRIEAFRPYYLDPSFDAQRPRITALPTEGEIRYGEIFEVDFSVGGSDGGSVEFKLYAPSFSTHSTQMNQRQLILEVLSVMGRNASSSGDGSSSSLMTRKARLKAPPSSTTAPAGYYLFFVVINGSVPSSGSWVRLL